MRRQPVPRVLAFAPILLFVGTGCDATQSISFTSGNLDFSVSSTELGIPDSLRDGTRVAAIPCGMSMCPPVDPVVVSCVGGACDPDPLTVTIPAGLVDFDMLSSELSTLFTVVDTIEITRVDYSVQRNTLNTDISSIDVFWGPEGAVDVSPEMGVHHLATVPPVLASTTPAGQAQVDAAGQRALNDYLVGSSRRIRLFAQTDVDIDPGDDFPTGELAATAVLSITATGSLLN